MAKDTSHVRSPPKSGRLGIGLARLSVVLAKEQSAPYQSETRERLREFESERNGAPEEIRTPSLLIRSQQMGLSKSPIFRHFSHFLVARFRPLPGPFSATCRTSISGPISRH